MPIMPLGERLFCRSTAWAVLARRAVLPWALSGESLAGDVLEIGGGGGAMAFGVLERFPAARVNVADLDPAMVRATAAHLAPFGERASASVADTTALPFDDDSFDAVASFLMLHHIGEWETAVAEVVRVLRPGGRFVGYDLTDTVASRGLHRLDGIRDLRSITRTTFVTALAVAGVRDPVLRCGRLTLRWVATKPG